MTIMRTTTLKEQLIPHLDQEDRGRVLRAIVGTGSINGAGCVDIDVIALPMYLCLRVAVGVQYDRQCCTGDAVQRGDQRGD